jgi:hypothetical protein
MRCMRCPHCRATPRYRDRGDGRCPACGRAFALDPRTNAMRLNDLRFRRLAARLGADGLRFTETQLWYASAAPRLRESATEKVHGVGMLTAVFVGVFGYGVLCLVAGLPAGNVAMVLIGIGCVLAAGGILWLRVLYLRRRLIAMPMSVDGFRSDVVERWVRVYDATPERLVGDAGGGGAAGPPAGLANKPLLVLVALDAGVRSCLVANGVSDRLRVRLVGSLAYVPAGVPVAVAHDASCAGYLFAEEVRAAVGGRLAGAVVPRPRAVMAAPGAVVLRDRPPPRAHIEAVRATGRLTEPELAWLARGWRSPVAALSPAGLVARVEVIAAHLAAESVGYLTWPERPAQHL